jgi:acyl-coenzyme A thioesterase PaaI-like protein
MAATPNPSFFNVIRNPLKFKLFLLQKLPAAFMSGIRLQSVSEGACTVSVPYKWATQNPFRSTYFACLAMAAEMSTGVLAMAHVQGRKPPLSMLIADMQSKFHKKATGLTFFTCNDGEAMQLVIQAAAESGEGQTFTAYTKGENERGELVAEFWFTWSFKNRKAKNSNI